MKKPIKIRTIPTRVTTGAFILNEGIKKWRGGPEQAQAVHDMAAAAMPPLRGFSPRTFLRLLAAGEIVTGALLLTPIVPAWLAGTALTAFSSGMMTLYARTPGMRSPGSIWPSPKGTSVAKDVWMLGIGTSLLLELVDPAKRDTPSKG